MSPLLESQMLFARLLPRLLDYVAELGLACTVGEVERAAGWALTLSKQGKGSLRSLHIDRLAVDVHLFRGATYLTRTEDHAALGAYWKTLHPRCRWGGDFGRPDGNHYSIEWGGRA